ncbi:DUF317 domain-containing protein [Streptomyces sp. SID13666]|uniref:DUF317 domain-containing protein n=1 Tax=unclassified Streptomyces TaxID=2593676 RepID=UPI0013C033BA|nr:DUF317 domain-containing protein [Streptomyces sp. H39-C1]MCZ4103068.1 DUF317 domain-containing protein [Streptomyces sp. H39-C1]NEA59393.1 DUF317 domain-containing protein [Streptomyces sp. SID13666]
MPVSERQLAAVAEVHAWRIPFDTSPRHLAGPGDVRHVTHGLAAAGWTSTSDPLSAEIILRSPDHHYSLQFDPQSSTSAWWRLRAEPTAPQQGWYAEFGELVPAEVLAGLTDTLIAPPSGESATLQPVLEGAGWIIDGRGVAYSDPSGCRVERRAENGTGTVPWREPERVSWQIEVRGDDELTARGPRLWHAWFDGHAPEHLVTAFVTALIDPAPLQRAMFDRTAHYSAVQQPSPLTPQQVVDAHTTRINTIRAQTRAARRQKQPTPATAPATPATARPASHR